LLSFSATSGEENTRSNHQKRILVISLLSNEFAHADSFIW
jgi:hypothetical protein